MVNAFLGIIMVLKVAISSSGRGFPFWAHLGFAYRILDCGTVKPPECLSAASFRRSVESILEPVASSNLATKREIPWNGFIQVRIFIKT